MIDKSVLSNGVHRGAVLFWFFFFLSTIYFTVCMIKKKNIGYTNFKSNLWVVMVGASIFFADFFYYQAVSMDNVSLSVISIVRKLSVFLSVVLASVFLKEDNLLKKALILLLMFIGLSIIIFL